MDEEPVAQTKILSGQLPTGCVQSGFSSIEKFKHSVRVAGPILLDPR